MCSRSSSGFRRACVVSMFVLDVADVGGGVDELLIERAPVGADGLDLELESGLGFQGRALLGARGVELLVVLLEHVEIGFCRRARGRDDRWRRDLWRRNLGGWGLRRGILSERGEVGAERQHECQSRAEHEARIGAARPSKNHRVQR